MTASKKPHNLSAALIALEKIKQKSGVGLETVEDHLKKNNQNVYHSSSYKIELLDPTHIVNWEFSDRPHNELGNITELAEQFKTIGQQQPCIVRPIKEKPQLYEMIAGERRCAAAKKAGIKLKAIILQLSNHDAALIQIAENKNRKGLSDYSKGMSFANLIENNILTQKELTEKLNISPQKISKLLSYKDIPLEIRDKIGDMSKVSATTAEKIKQLSKKGDNYIQVIKSLSEEIKNGKIGHVKLDEKVKIALSDSVNLSKENKIYNKNKELCVTLHISQSKSYMTLSPFMKKLFLTNKEEFFNELARVFLISSKGF